MTIHSDTPAISAAREDAALDARVLEDFRRDGFVLLPRAFGAREMLEVAGWVDEVVGWPERPGRHMVYYEDDRCRRGRRVLSRIENFCPYHAGLRGLLTGPRTLAWVQSLLGEPAVMFKDKINFKLPGSGGFEPHQDAQAGWQRYAPRHLTLLLSVDAATPENGCLELAAGWHRHGLIGELWTPLGDAVPDAAYRACPTAVGDVVLFDSFAPHRSAPNRTAAPRRVLYLTYNAASAGDSRARYYADKRASFPPDCERDPDREYVYRV